MLGVALLVAAGLEAGKSLRLSQSGQHLRGQVVDIGAGPGRLFVRFARPDGQITTFRAGWLMGARPGQQVPVLFDPTRPGVLPAVATPLALWLTPAAMGIGGMLLFGFGFGRKRETIPPKRSS